MEFVVSFRLEDQQKAVARYWELQQQQKDNEIKSAHRAQERAQQRAAAAAAAAASAEQARLAKESGELEAQAEPEPVSLFSTYIKSCRPLHCPSCARFVLPLL